MMRTDIALLQMSSRINRHSETEFYTTASRHLLDKWGLYVLSTVHIQMKPDTLSLDRFTMAIAWLLSLIIAVLAPLVFFITSYQNLLSILEGRAQLAASSINSIISSNPTLWQFEELRLTEILNQQPHDTKPELRQIIFNNVDVIAQNNQSIPKPSASFSMNIHDAGTVVGQIKVTRSLNPLLARTLLITFFSISVAVIFFSVFRAIPIRIIKKAYQSVEDSEKKYRLLYETMTEGMALHKVSFDKNGAVVSLTVIDANQSCAAMLNLELGQITGKNSLELFGSTLLEFISGKMPIDIDSASPFELQLPGRHKIYNVHVFSPDQGLIATLFEDITDRKKSEQRFHRMAYFDTLTGLPNRILFMDRLNKAISIADREDKKLAVLFLDLDHFKEINDTLGHDAGDQLLVEITKRLNQNIRTSDTVSRFGGDEFVFVITSLDDQQNVTFVAQNLINAIQAPFHISSNELNVTSSIGIAIFPNDGDTAEILIRNADLAMYHSKETGRNTYNFYSPSMNEKATLHRNIETGLRNALAQGELLLKFQPVVNVDTNQITAAEAFVHWNHPTRGLIPPAEFITLAEETGLIIPVGEWVLNNVCSTMNAWSEAGLPPIRVSINISNRQMEQHNFMELIKLALAKTNTNSSQLEIEFTESCLVDIDNETITEVFKLRNFGVAITIEDFGTGYSSIGYIRNLLIDHIKIDRLLIKDITTNILDQAIVEAVFAMSNKLEIQIIAEGVETIEQLNYLKILGCKEIQGYYFYRPMSADALELLLRQQGMSS